MSSLLYVKSRAHTPNHLLMGSHTWGQDFPALIHQNQELGAAPHSRACSGDSNQPTLSLLTLPHLFLHVKVRDGQLGLSARHLSRLLISQPRGMEPGPAVASSPPAGVGTGEWPKQIGRWPNFCQQGAKSL